MKIRQVAAELFHADGRTDTRKLIVTFRNFAKALKICMHEGSQMRMKWVNVCYHSLRILLSSSSLSKNIKVKIRRTVIFPVVSYGCEAWPLTLRENHRLRVFEKSVLREIFGLIGTW
jgi:hypothetical protein